MLELHFLAGYKVTYSKCDLVAVGFQVNGTYFPDYFKSPDIRKHNFSSLTGGGNILNISQQVDIM